jgi:DNA gyrase subunit B
MATASSQSKGAGRKKSARNTKSASEQSRQTTNPNSGSYQASDIEVLEGLEAVRRRPAMYIGTTDTRGLHHLLWEIVDNCVDEFLAGETDRISVTLHKDGSSITVSDNGRGIPVDEHPKTKTSALELILTTLHAGGKFSDKNYARSGGLHGVGASVVNALSIQLIATVRRDGHEWMQAYTQGRPKAAVKKVRRVRGHGTTIFFRPDDSIFRRTRFHPDTIRQHLEDISFVHGGLKIIFHDETHGETHELHHPEGITAYLQKITADGQKKTVHETPFDIVKDERANRIEVVLHWSEAIDEETRSYVNGIRTHAGGTHESGLRSGIAKAVRNYMDVHNIKPKGISITNDDIREGLVMILSVFLAEPMFQGQTKEKLNNPELSGEVESLIRPGLETWLNANPSVADAILGRIVLSARARLASRDAAKEIRRKTPANRRNTLPGKLYDCRAGNREDSELFIVEGDSAGGTAAMGRNSRTQAVLPLRGKVLNTESLSTTKIMTNQSIQDLVETLGTGIGNDCDIRKLRYGRIILLMDADSDGYHISTLLLTFFFRHMRELIRQGKLFIAQPPLYRIEIGNQTYYAQDDADKEQVLAAAPAGRKVVIDRFKGLGEMNADQLKDTTLDPARRILLRVDIENQIEADNTFRQLLGRDASERYHVIMEEAEAADDLDI